MRQRKKKEAKRSEKENLNLVEAEVPVSEMFKYSTDLRSMSQGRGSFEYEVTGYDVVPANIAQKIVDNYKKENA